ncbi:MAG: hypothetical protein KatS3mg128_1051 [Silanimonas sp.]|nr:MAG: hypothetical protein KatS3mg128_1051 [Silanimonas sp.]
MTRRMTAAVVLLALAVFGAGGASAGERQQQRLVERHAEALSFPVLVERCRSLPAFADAPWQSELAEWRKRRAATLAEAAALVERIAASQGQSREAIDTAIRQQAEQRFATAEADTLAYTCGRLRLTLRGEPALPLTGNTLDEDTRAEVLDEIIPVASKLMACEALEGVRVRPAPPPILRPDASSMSALADRVEMWDVKGCGRSLDVEVSLRFPEGEPPTFALGFPRTARPLPQ